MPIFTKCCMGRTLAMHRLSIEEKSYHKSGYNFIIRWLQLLRGLSTVSFQFLTFFQYWNDPRFSWNKTEYEEISQVIINPEKAWLPDVVLLNRWVSLCLALLSLLIKSNRNFLSFAYNTIVKALVPTDLASQSQTLLSVVILHQRD